MELELTSSALYSELLQVYAANDKIPYVESILQYIQQKVAKYILDGEVAMKQKDIPRISQSAYSAIAEMYIRNRQHDKAAKIIEKMRNNVHIVIKKNG